MESPATKSAQVLLDEWDPLYHHLARVGLPALGVEIGRPEFESVCLSNGQKAVYLYRERTSNTHLVGKFFGARQLQPEIKLKASLNREFANLIAIRKIGFYEPPRRVVRPISKDENINCVLVEEFVRGRDLDYYIRKAVHTGKNHRLMKKLETLAHFFARLHRLSLGKSRVDVHAICIDFKSMIESLAWEGTIPPTRASAFHRLCDQWEQNLGVSQERDVLVHGDATPTNFIFHPDDGVTAIDLERMRRCDRTYDLGLIASELKHHFAWRMLRADAAEPYISHFFKAYCDHFEDPEPIFDQVAERNRFFMALGELRIAQNRYMQKEHRRWLTEEAFRCLQP